MNTKKCSCWLVIMLFSIAGSAVAAEPLKLPPPDRFHLYLLVGQSNMAGRGEVSAEDKTPQPRVLMLNKTGAWVPAVDPMHFDKSSAGVGLGRTFGMEIAKTQPEITIGLIPCAVGGSPIDVWKPGSYYAATKSHPWDDALARAKLAMKSGELRGILWHQGESDSTPQLAPEYEAKLHALIQAFRKELNAPQAPFIVGQMGQFAEKPWNDAQRIVDRTHTTLPDKIPFTAFVSSEKLQHKGDKIHFDAASYREFGKRYAEAYLKLLEASAKKLK